MLKLNYSDLGLNVERIEGTIESIVSMRVLLAIRVGDTLCAEPGTASFLVAIDHPWFDKLLTAIEQANCADVDICVADAASAEVSVRGTWIASSPDAHEGILICALGNRLEAVIDRMWAIDRIENAELRM
jgi:energy-converting hydrogenase Eha subunit B